MPRISVIIPTYNRATYLPATLDSVLAQTFGDFEIIVVDDGSTDETPEVLRRYEGKIVALFQDNQREGAARNHGIRRASGEFLAFLDSDDLWLPHKLEADMAAFERYPQAALAYSRAEYISSSGELLGGRRMPTPEGDIFDALVLENFITLSTATVRQGAFHAVGLFNPDRQLSGSIDWEAWVRLAARYPVVHVPQVTTRVRVHVDNMLSNGIYMERAVSKALELVLGNPSLQARLAGRESSMRASLYQAIAVNYCSNGQMSEARRWLLRAVRTWPLQVRDPRLSLTFGKSLLGARLSARLRRWRRHLGNRSAANGHADQASGFVPPRGVAR